MVGEALLGTSRHCNAAARGIHIFGRQPRATAEGGNYNGNRTAEDDGQPSSLERIENAIDIFIPNCALIAYNITQHGFSEGRNAAFNRRVLSSFASPFVAECGVCPLGSKGTCVTPRSNRSMTRKSVALTLGLVCVLSATTFAAPTQIRLLGVTGNRNTGEGGRDPNDQRLFEINLTDFSLTPIFSFPFVPDTISIGFNPSDGLLYRTGGAGAYRNDPTRIGFNDNYFFEKVDVYDPAFPQTAIFNSNPQGDGTHGPYGIPGPRPDFILPAERRTDDQIDPSFRQQGENEYSAMRDLVWSAEEQVFYGADGDGIFKLTADGKSTFLDKPANQPKGIAFFNIGGERRLLLADRDNANLYTIDPMTGQAIGDPVEMVDPDGLPMTGVLSLAEHPLGDSLYGIRAVRDAGGDSIGRQLIRINPVSGTSTFLSDLNDTGDALLSDLAFVFKDVPESHNWVPDADGTWSTAANWTGGEPNANGAIAGFLGAITAPHTVTIDGPKTVGSITFDNANSYTLAGAGPLQINSGTAAATINVVNGSHTISAPLAIAAGTTVTRSGAGTLTISGTQNHGAGAILNATGGVTNLNSDGGTNLAVQANARVNFGSSQHLAGLQVGAGSTAQMAAGAGKLLVTPTLSIAGDSTPTGTFDLNESAAVIDYTGTSPVATVRAQILSGRGGSGLGKTWNGPGITSSAAAAADAETRSIGYAENSAMPLGQLATFHGQAVDGTSILMAFTRTGDANLDGVVNDDDVTIVSATYAPGVANAAWAQGDFDYNGFVDDDDITLLGAFYDPGATPIAAPITGVAAVPEPATVTLILVGIGIGLACCRRRSSAE
jgi:hypothetical protein